MKDYAFFEYDDDDLDIDYLLATKKCACCGKEICGLYDWNGYAYQKKNPVRFYCSWTCYRKEKEPQKRIYLVERRIRCGNSIQETERDQAVQEKS